MKLSPRSLVCWFVGLSVLAVAAGGFPGVADDAAPAGSNSKTLPQPVVDTHELMELFNKQWYVEAKKTMDQEPADDKGWGTIQDRGYQAAEVMNLVALRNDKHSQHPAWSRHVQSAQKAGLRMAEAGKAKDWDKAQQAYAGLIRNCNQCHQAVAPEMAPQVQP